MPKNFWINKWSNKVCSINRTRLRKGKNKLGQDYCVFLDCKHDFIDQF